MRTGAAAHDQACGAFIRAHRSQGIRMQPVPADIHATRAPGAARADSARINPHSRLVCERIYFAACLGESCELLFKQPAILIIE